MDSIKNLQPDERAGANANKPEARYVMPGIKPRIVAAFRRKHDVIPTARTLASNKGYHPGVVTAALIHELFDQVEELRAIVSRRPPASEMGIRSIRRVA